MITLNSLKNTTRRYQRRKLLGRGPGSKRGKTCTRGHKGAGSRSGYSIRAGYIGGGVPMHRRMPTRGFSNARFARRLDSINLDMLERHFNDGEIVSVESLREKGLVGAASCGIKILGNGILNKKLRFQVEAFSNTAIEKLQNAGMNV